MGTGRWHRAGTGQARLNRRSGAEEVKVTGAPAGDHGLWVSVLGPVRLTVAGVAVEVPGTRRRAVLALLAMAAPEAIGSDRLVDAVWPDDPPRSGRAALQSHVSRIRRHLGAHADRLESTGFGYRLALGAEELDAATAARLVREAREAAPGDPGSAARLLREARALWRGPPLADVTEVPDLAAWSRALGGQWVEASELLIECALAADDTSLAAAVAAEVVDAEPLREDAVVLQVRALAAQGRTAEALRTAHAFRGRLAEETGLEPSPALAEVEHRVAAGAEAATRPERSITPTGAGIAAPPAPLLGRDAELAGVTRLLARERLVTIVGPGGVGKTHLALEAAHRVAVGSDVTLVRLAAVTDGGAVPDVLARALGLQAGAGDVVDRCALRLRSGPHLLVLDNCEHLLQPVRVLTTSLLEACPALTVLATSRERLAVPLEQTCRLAPLPMPDPTRPDEAGRTASVALLVDRARRVRPDFDLGPRGLSSVAGIIRAVDGLPLAIELAAGRLSSMNVADVEARLDRALDLLGRGPAPGDGAEARHRTLRAAIAWSYDLVPDDEQRLFRHLAVFADGFDLDTAETVAHDLGLAGDPGSALAHLVDASLVVAELDGVPRYRMLDSLRAYGIDRLRAEGELDAAAQRLRRWAVELARWFEEVAETDDELAADARLRREVGNLRAAWSDTRAAHDLDSATEIALSLFWAGAWRDLAELWRWAFELAADDDIEGHPRQAAVLGLAAEASWFSAGDLDRAEALAQRACELATRDDPRAWAMSRGALADVTLFRGRYEESRDLTIDARRGTPYEAEGYAQAALAAGYGGEVDAARELLDVAKSKATSPTLRAWTRYAEGELAGLSGDWPAAEAAYRDAIDITGITGAHFIEGVASVGLVSALVAQGVIDDALRGYRQLVDRWERTGGWTQQWTTLRNLADLLEQLGDVATARELRDAADAAPEAAVVHPAGDAGAVRRDGPRAVPDHRRVLDLARSAIDQALAARCAPPRSTGRPR